MTAIVPRIRIQPTVLPYLCLLPAFAGEGAAASFLLACLAHEAGHLFWMAVFRVPIKEIRIGYGGVAFCGDFARCGYGQEAIVCLGGVAVNGLLAAVFAFLSMPFPTALHVLLLVYNLLPLGGHDGTRVLYALIGCVPPAVQACLFRILSLLSTLTEAAACVFGAWLCWFFALRTGAEDALPLLCFTWILSVFSKTVFRPRTEVGQYGVGI